MAKCTKCGGAIDRARLICSSCGARAELVTFGFTSDAPIITLGMSAKRSASGNTETHVMAPGSTSEAQIDGAGQMAINVRGAKGVGTLGESRVATMLCQRLNSDGHQASYSSAEDSRGEDRILDVNGTRFVLQVTVIPGDRGFWRDANLSSASTIVPPAQSAQWIEDCLQRKAQAAERSQTVLALDALHAAPLAEPAIIQEYLSRYGDPARRLGFASVWVVGPTPLQCARIGSGSV
jgi:hypothetical protein